MTLQEQVTAARARFVRAGISAASAGLDAELLARLVLGWDRATYLVNRQAPPPHSFAGRYEPLVRRRERREPLAQITGRREFWGLDFEVTRDVLTPRPETELIVEEALARLAGRDAGTIRLVDAGTGSGCLAVALAVELPAARLVATDISLAALAVARRNAARHGVAPRIRFVATSFLAGLGAAPDLIVSNPPYVPAVSAPALPPEVREYEPTVALFAGPDGLDAVRELVRQAALTLRPGGRLIFEFGCGQEEDVRALVAARPRLAIETVRDDLQGIARLAVLVKE